MVKKFSRVEINSGNTFRTCKARFYRQYNRLAYLYRLTFTESYTVLDDFNINADYVAYSLNKRHRWQLPDIIRNEIDLDYRFDVDSSIKLVVSYALLSSNRVTEYYSSKGAILNKGERLINRESLETEKRKSENDVEVQIDVVYPCPPTHSFSYQNKKTGFSLVISERKQYTKNHTKKNRRYLDGYCKNVKEEHDYESTLITNKKKKGVTHAYTDVGEDVYDAELSRYIFKRDDVKDSIFTKHLHHVISNKATTKPQKTKIMKRQEQEEVNKDTNQAKKKKSTHLINSVIIKIPKDELDPSTLRMKFGEKYTECQCFPRKFIIDVSDMLEQHGQLSDRWKKEEHNRWDLTACIVFTYDVRKNKENELFEIYRVHFNITTKKNKPYKIKTESDHFEGSMGEVLKWIVGAIDSLPTSAFIEKEREPLRPPTSTDFKILNIYQNVHIESHSISRECSYMDIFKSDCAPAVKTNIISNELDKIEVCGICYDQIVNNCKETTTLNVCGHVFCNDCWKNYCKVRYETVHVTITCPAYKCENIVPTSVLFAFLDIRHVNKLISRREELLLNSQENTLCCPNINCSRVMFVKIPKNATSIACECGLELCFLCHKYAHWPVSCEYANQYWITLKQQEVKKAFDLLQQTQPSGDFKQCPNCKIYIERVGSGIFISCICGVQFCWGCLHIHPHHRNYKNCFLYKKDILTKKTIPTVKISYRDHRHPFKSTSHASSYQKLALNHRIARDPLTIKTFKDRIRKIIVECGTIPKKKCTLYIAMFEKFELPDDNNFPSSRRKVKQKISGALRELVNVYITLHHVAEYSFIMLEELSKKGVQQLRLCTHIDQLSALADKIASILRQSVDLKDFRSFIESILTLEQKCHSTVRAYTNAIQEIK